MCTVPTAVNKLISESIIKYLEGCFENKLAQYLTFTSINFIKYGKNKSFMRKSINDYFRKFHFGTIIIRLD